MIARPGNFVHLRVHSEYSVADGLIKVRDLARRAAGLDMPAVALTDRGNLFGLIKFYEAALAAGVQPLIGVDFQYRDPANQAACRCLALAANNRGYRRIIELASKAYVDAAQRGWIERSWLCEDTEGMLLLSGGIAGDVGQALVKGDVAHARSLAESWQRAYGERAYLELMRTGREGESVYVPQAVDLAQRLGMPVVATNDVCFLDRDDFEAHETRVCVHDSRTLNDPRRERRYSEEQYFKSGLEMGGLFEDIPEALANAAAIAQRCSATIGLDTYYLPNYPVPQGTSLEHYLEDLSRQGLARLMGAEANERASSAAPPLEKAEIYQARLEEELGMINQMGFAGYFLIVAEFIGWARENGIPVGPGRGSGAGSVVAWALGITGIDPIRYDLLFERFLNPERVSMPDFDIDFCMEGRDRVIAHVAERYGHDAVSQIITFGTMAAKAVVRDVARVQGKPYGLADRVSKLIPFEVGMTLTKAVAEVDELKELIDASDEVAEIMDMAYKLEGVVRNVGKHAGGVVIAPSKLTDFVPLYVDEGSHGLISQFDKDDVERAGLVKFDFLGLKTLTIIDWAVAAINVASDEPITIEAIPLDDPATFELLKQAQTTAVFQLESRGMKELIRGLLPDRFEDIIALVALFRPGPLQSGMVEDFIQRKHGRARVEYPHPDLQGVLANTYGVILYQEQVMQIAQVLAGFTLGQADLLRRAMGKKKPEEMAKQREQFAKGAEAGGVAAHLATAIFDLMEKFAGYGFNKSHSAAYALVSYQTAWLKAHHPAHFMAAVLSVDMQNIDKVVMLIDEVAHMSLTLDPPDVNRSGWRFSVVEGRIVYGLGAVRGVGEGPVAGIVAARAEAGRFRDLADFCLRLGQQVAHKRVIEALIRAGAMDCFSAADEDLEKLRGRLLAELPVAVHGAEQAARDAASGMTDLFGGVGEGAPVATPAVASKPLSRHERLEGEKETLGLYLTGHPIDDYIEEIRKFCPGAIADLKAERGNQLVAGLVVSTRTMRSRRGDMAFTMLDDKSGRIELAVFSDVMETSRHKLAKDAVLVAEGVVAPDDRNGQLKMRVENVYTMEEARRRFANWLEIDVSTVTGADLAGRLRRLMEPGAADGCPVAVNYRCTDAEGRVVLGDAWRVVPSDDVLARFRAEFGTESVHLAYRRGM